MAPASTYLVAVDSGKWDNRGELVLAEPVGTCLRTGEDQWQATTR
jgi:hypothetical protein